MLPENQDENVAEGLGHEVEQANKKPEIDLQALAQEVMVLLKQELRMERERSGWDKRPVKGRR